MEISALRGSEVLGGLSRSSLPFLTSADDMERPLRIWSQDSFQRLDFEDVFRCGSSLSVVLRAEVSLLYGGVGCGLYLPEIQLGLQYPDLFLDFLNIELEVLFQVVELSVVNMGGAFVFS